MNSFNHYSFGAVAAWMYNYSLGIQRHPTKAGFKEFILMPTPDPNGQITEAKGHYDSMYGRINSAWKSSEILGVIMLLYLPIPVQHSIYQLNQSLKLPKMVNQLVHGKVLNQKKVLS
jgi:type IV secretory pathway TrbF-like protein